MKKIYALFVLLAVFSACKKKSSNPEEKPITIAAIMPTSGLPGTEVTITGSQFGTVISDVNVKINGTAAEVVAVTNESIRIKVKTATTTGKVVVTVKGKEIQGPDFTITNVQITEVYPKAALTGETVTLTGVNFGTDKTKATLLFGSTPAEIVEITNTFIKTKVPANFEEGKIKLQVLDAVIESSEVFLNDVSGIVDESFENSLSGFIWINSLATNGQFIFAVGAGEGGLAIFDMQGKLIKKFTSANGFSHVNGTFIYSAQFHPSNPNRVYISGQFSTFNGKPAPNFASLIYSGGEWILDENFKQNVPRSAYTCAFQIINSQLKILVGQNNNPLIRLNEDGSVDNSFNQGEVGFANSSSGGLHIRCIAVEPGENGKIVVGGTFNSFNGTPVGILVRLNANGSLDYTYPSIGFGNGNIGADFLKLDEQNNVYFAGRDVINSNFSTDKGIIKINRATGSSFNLFKAANKNSFGSIPEVNYMATSRTGRYLLLGSKSSFSMYDNKAINGIAMVNQNGTLNTNFGNNGTLDVQGVYFYAALRLPNGKFMIGGFFDAISGKSYNGLAIIK